ncbi:MAG: hypothetical protein CMJ18_09065 [Phycisphaeraceae bacterium]|nr:hypothetical protein [Phycisphaeraceae bacterium]
MEHRQRNRWPQQGSASAFCLSAHRFGEIHDLRMLDYGEGGMGALSQQPIEPGAPVTLGFDGGYTAARGVVVACTPVGQDYRLSFRFEGSIAA